MVRELTPVEKVSYSAYNFSINLHNDIVLSRLLDLINSLEGSVGMGLNENDENIAFFIDRVNDLISNEIMINSPPDRVGYA
jgi:hypothetical protein